MRMQHQRGMERRIRRGMSLVEVMVAGTIALWMTTLLVGMASFHSRVWQNGMADGSAQMSGQMAVQRMAPQVRTARKVLSAQSSSTVLMLQMPKYDANGNLIIPMQDGVTEKYYLSDTSGKMDVKDGTILWRAVNGTADRGWSLQNGKGRIVVAAADGIQFSYYPANDPETVTVTIKTANTTGTKTSYFTTSQELLLRNRL